MNWMTEQLTALQQQNLKRSLRTVEQFDGPRLILQGKPLINFSSNNYLGMARHPQVLDAVRQVLEHWGAGATASRLICGTTVIHKDLEDALTAYMGTEAALLFPTGYMANLGVLSALVGDGDAVIADRLCHASIIDAARLCGARLFVYTHGDAGDAERVLQRAAAYRRRVLVTDSLFSMDGDFAPLDALARLAGRYEAISVLDEAHAIGVWGKNGRGARAMDGRSERWDVIVGTLSKALGSQGGFVAGSAEFIETLVNKARSFIYTTGLAPAAVAAAQAALSLLQEDARPREHLQRLATRLREGLRQAGFNTLASDSQIVPVLLGEAESALACSRHLEASGIFAPAIRPPTVHAGECRLRFSVTSEHGKKEIDQLLDALRSWKGKHE